MMTFFLIFSSKICLDVSCKLSLLATICMKSRSKFSGKNKKIISKCRLLKLLPSMLSMPRHIKTDLIVNMPVRKARPVCLIMVFVVSSAIYIPTKCHRTSRRRRRMTITLRLRYCDKSMRNLPNCQNVKEFNILVK